jgi:hypothetical protein
MEREIEWTTLYGNTAFTIYRNHKVTRTEYAGTMIEVLSSETGLPLEWTRECFINPGAALNRIDEKVNV